MSDFFGELDSQLYDDDVPDWEGEIAFYQDFVSLIHTQGQDVLEIACGTGRVTRQLAQRGVKIVGLEISAPMLEIARKKSAALTNVTWIQGDMRSFELREQFGLVIIPGHSFQFMLTPEDQTTCLDCIKHHLLPNGVLIIHLDHQDIDWLGALSIQKEPQFEEGNTVIHPQTGVTYRSAYAWSYERSTQTAILLKVWDELNAQGEAITRHKKDPLRLHCVFPFEMEHLAKRMGFTVEATYGDFMRTPLNDSSKNMVWVLRN